MKQRHILPRWVAARLCAAAGALLLAGCVFVPRTTQVYDEACQIHARHMTLEPEVIQGLVNCSNQGCTGMLITAGVITAASAVDRKSVV